MADALFGSTCKDVKQKSGDTFRRLVALLQAEDKTEASVKRGRETNDARSKITTKRERKFMFEATISCSLSFNMNKLICRYFIVFI